MSAQTEHVEALESLRDDAAAMLVKAQELNEKIQRMRLGIPLVDPVRVWNIQVYAENALLNLELKAKGVSMRVRSA